MEFDPAKPQATPEGIHKLKVVLIGDVSVGKTALAIRFAKGTFESGYRATTGASFINKVAHVGNEVINFMIWDTAGQERYRSLAPVYMRGAHIAFIVYDVTNQESFNNVAIWLEVLQHHGDMVKTVLVANKCDLESTVDEALALEFAENNSIQYVHTSALSGYNVDKLFMQIASKVVNEIKRHENQSCRHLDRVERVDEDTEKTLKVDVIEVKEEKIEKSSKCCRS